MKYAFLISGLVELLGGLICEFYPSSIFLSFDRWMVSIFGLSIMVLGIINLLAFKHYRPTKLMKGLFLSMLFYHGAVAMIIHRAPSDLLSQPLAAILLHLFLFLLFLLCYLGGIKPDSQPQDQITVL